jgi:hypothetical protein
MRKRLLQYLLVVDAFVLLVIGLILILAPKRVEAAFHFNDLPPAVGYLIGMWGCVFVTMAIGYAVAAKDPVRHAIWVQVAIARSVLEAIFGAVYIARGVITFEQGGFGIIVAVLVAVAYIALYPRGGNETAAARA